MAVISIDSIAKKLNELILKSGYCAEHFQMRRSSRIAKHLAKTSSTLKDIEQVVLRILEGEYEPSTSDDQMLSGIAATITRIDISLTNMFEIGAFINIPSKSSTSFIKLSRNSSSKTR